MPRKPNKPCRYPLCPNKAIGKSGYCLEHQKQVNSDYDKYTRSPDYKKRYGSEWQRIRARYVISHPLCERCLKEGKYTPVEEVHHIVPLDRGGTNDESNLMSLCRSCHNKIHIELGDRHPKE